MAVVIERTANPNGVSSSSSVATYSGVAIGAAATNRIVVVLVASELTSASINSVTLGGITMNAGTQGNFGAVHARAFYLLYPTGTTADIVVTYGANASNTQNHIAVYSVTGAAYSATGADQSSDMDATDRLTTGAITIASGGGFIAVAGGATDGTAKTWANASEDLDVDAGGFRFTTATRTTALTATAVTCTGGTNGEDGALSYLLFTANTSASSERGLYVEGSESANSERGLYAIGSVLTNSERGLYLQGRVSESSERGLYIIGEIATTSERGLYVTGIAEVNSERSLYLQGAISTNSEKGLYLTGNASVNSERELYLIGQDSTNSERLLYLTGKALADSERVLWVYGTGATDRYWVGGSGNWGDTAHWSLTSAGTGGAGVPDETTDVFIDEGSGVSEGIIVCDTSANTRDFTSTQGNDYILDADITVYGDLLLEPGIFITGTLDLEGESQQVDFNGAHPSYTMSLKNGTKTLLSDVTVGTFSIEDSIVDLNDYNINAIGVEISNNTVGSTAYLGTGTITTQEFWVATLESFVTTIHKGSSTIVLKGWKNMASTTIIDGGSGWSATDVAYVYNEFGKKFRIFRIGDYGTVEDGAVTSFLKDTVFGFLPNTTYTAYDASDYSKTFTFQVTSFGTAEPVYIMGEDYDDDWNPIGYRDFVYNNLHITGDQTGGVKVYGSNTFNGFSGGNTEATIYFDANSTQTVSSFTVNGESGALITLDIMNGEVGDQATLSMASGTVNVDYLDINNSNATGGATWIAGSNSINGGNNTGWIWNQVGERNLYIQGSDSQDSERGLYAWGTDNTNSERSLYATGSATTNSERGLYGWGTDSADSERGLYTTGNATANSERGLWAEGSATETSERTLYTWGTASTDSERVLYTKGVLAADSERGLYTWGVDSGNSNRDLYTWGEASTESERGLYVIGGVEETSERGLYTKGVESVTLSIDYFDIDFYAETSSTRGLYVGGGLEETSNRRLYLKGSDTAESERTLYLYALEGSMRGLWIRGGEPFDDIETTVGEFTDIDDTTTGSWVDTDDVTTSSWVDTDGTISEFTDTTTTVGGFVDIV